MKYKHTILQNFKQVPLTLYSCLIFLFLLLPIIIIIPMSFNSARYLEFPPQGISLRWYNVFFHSTDWTAALRLSLEIGIYTTILATVLGTLSSLALVRGRIPFKYMFFGFFTLPIIIPIIITAVGIYFLFSSLHLVGTRLGLTIAHTLLALPVVIIPVSASLQRLDRHLEWQALNLGASHLRTFFSVIFPLIRVGIFTGALFAFITSFDEILIAIFLSAGSAVTLPKKIWEGIRFEINPTISVVASILIVISTCVMLLIIFLQYRQDKLKP